MPTKHTGYCRLLICVRACSCGGIATATAAAAAIAKARRDIQHEFFGRDAVAADRAIDFDLSRHTQRRVFERWERAGVIRKTTNGRYWLDIVAYDVDLRGRHNRVRIILLIVLILLAVGLITELITLGHR